MTNPERPTRDAVRSFVRRTERITPAQSRALASLADAFGVPAGGPLDLEALFGRSAPVWLEIGFGDGDTLLALAARHPQVNLLGVEVHDPGVGRAVMRLRESGLTNVRVVHGDVIPLLAERLAPATVSRILLLFPDPWPKKRHHKRRIVQPGFARLVASRLCPGGLFQAATDWSEYARHMLEVLDAEPALANLAGRGQYMPEPHERPQTKFERRGLALGHRVADLVYERVHCDPADNRPQNI